MDGTERKLRWEYNDYVKWMKGRGAEEVRTFEDWKGHWGPWPEGEEELIQDGKRYIIHADGSQEEVPLEG